MFELVQILERLVVGVGAAQRLIAFWGPLPSAPALLGPLAAIGSVVLLALISGIAVGSLATLIVAGLVLYLLLTEVFGFSFDVALP